MSGLRTLLDVLWPDVCPGCGGLAGTHGQTPLCAACDALVPTLPRAVAVPPPVAGAWVLGPYEGVLGALLRRGKYRPDPLLVEALGERLAEAACGRVPPVDRIVPVPVTLSRRLQRGFNQAELLGAPLARALGLPLERALQREIAGKQAALDQAGRQRGAREAFRSATTLSGRVLLVDDVLTTGATAAACATELLGAGASRVYLLTLVASRMEPPAPTPARPAA